MKIKPITMWVAPEFKNMMKSEAALQGMNLTSFTHKLAQQRKDEPNTSKKDIKRGFWDFGF